MQPGAGPQPRHAVGALGGTLAKQVVGGIHVTKTYIHRGNFVRTEVLVFGGVLHAPDQRFGLFLQSGDRENMRLQGENGQTVVQLRSFLYVFNRLFEPALLSVRHALKGQDERRIRFELQALSGEFDRFVVPPREEQLNGSYRVIRIDSGSRSIARRTSRTASSCRPWVVK